MNFKGVFLIGSGMAILAIAAFTAYFLRQAAAEAAVSRRILQAESECAGEVPRAVDLVTARDGAKTRVTETSSHYNHQLTRCYVEVDTYEHGATAIYTKTLISPAENGAVLWTVKGRPESPERQCFGPDALPLDCGVADKRWKTFMTQ
jgi:hypothetical protein